MFITHKPLILASASPRRKAFLEQLGLNFTIDPADVDETPLPLESPAAYVRRIAVDKAVQVGGRQTASWVLAADTTVVLDERIIGKPNSYDEAVAMLLSLAGRTHTVMTGFALCCRTEDSLRTGMVTTAVSFAPFGRALARAYARTGEPFDKAGGYGIQGKGGMLVSSIAGSYSNVVGLPLAEIVELLRVAGVIAECC